MYKAKFSLFFVFGLPYIAFDDNRHGIGKCSVLIIKLRITDNVIFLYRCISKMLNIHLLSNLPVERADFWSSLKLSIDRSVFTADNVD